MVQVALHQSTAELPKVQHRIRHLVFAMALETLLLMAIGSATRVMNAGLACPDWPLCYGELIPRQQMNFQVFLEWFHRLAASSMGLLAIALAVTSWWARRSLPGWLPWASTFALGLIVFQGVLGGLTVTELLRFDIVTAHLATALLFFVTLVTIGMLLLPYRGTGTVSNLPWIGLISAIAVYVQSILGALVASQWALHQCLSDSHLCRVMNSHLIGVIPATLSPLVLVVVAWRTPALHPLLRNLANTAVGLVVLQVFLGVATLKMRLQVEPLTVAHQAIGAALLGVLVSFTVLALRDMATLTLPKGSPQIPSSQSIPVQSMSNQTTKGQLA